MRGLYYFTAQSILFVILRFGNTIKSAVKNSDFRIERRKGDFGRRDEDCALADIRQCARGLSGLISTLLISLGRLIECLRRFR